MGTRALLPVEEAANDAVRLKSAAETLGVRVSDVQIQQMLDLIALLSQWNRTYNLTAIRAHEQMVVHHLFDCLACVAPLDREIEALGAHAARLVDVGSGGGLPGAVLSIARPHLEVTCVDAVGKKAAFVAQAAARLGLTGLHAVHGRVQDQAGEYDVITSRAFASLTDFTSWTRHLLRPHGKWMAMKGHRPDAEIAQLAADVDVFHVEPLAVPGLGAERCLIWMQLR